MVAFGALVAGCVGDAGTAPATAPPLVAAFSYDVTYESTGPIRCVARSVQFADESTGGPTAWSWTFPDGTTLKERSPVYSSDPDPEVRTGPVVLVVTNGDRRAETTQILQVVRW